MFAFVTEPLALCFYNHLGGPNSPYSHILPPQDHLFHVRWNILPLRLPLAFSYSRYPTRIPGQQGKDMQATRKQTYTSSRPIFQTHSRHTFSPVPCFLVFAGRGGKPEEQHNGPENSHEDEKDPVANLPCSHRLGPVSMSISITVAPLTRPALPTLPTYPAKCCLASRAGHRRTTRDLLHVVATAGTRLDVLAFLPFEVALVAHLLAALVLVRPGGGTVGAELVTTRLALDSQITTDVFSLWIFGEMRDPITIGLRASRSPCARGRTPHASSNQQQWPGS